MNSVRFASRIGLNHSFPKVFGKNYSKFHTIPHQSSSLIIFLLIVPVMAYSIRDKLFGKVKNAETLKDVDAKTQEKIDEISKKMSIAQPVTGYISEKSNESSAIGNDYFWCAPKIFLAEPILDFIIAHELAHIKHCHSFKTFGGLVVPTLFVLTNMTKLSIATRISAELGLIAAVIGCYTLLSRYQEKQADLTAASHITIKEIAKGIKWFFKIQSGQQLQREFTKDWMTTLAISSNGDLNFLRDPFPMPHTHPPLSERMRYLSEIIYSRGNEEQIPLTVSIHEKNGEVVQELKVSSDVNTEIRKMIQDSSRKYSWIDLEHLKFYPDEDLVFSDKEEIVFHRTSLNSKHIDEAILSKTVGKILGQPLSLYLPSEIIPKEVLKAVELKFKESGYFIDRLQRKSSSCIMRATKPEE